MKLPRVIIVTIAIPWLSANYVPPSTEKQLTSRSDLVVVGRVVEAGLTPPPAPADRTERGTFIIGTLAGFPCVKVIVEHTVKGQTRNDVEVCAHRISEMNARTPQVGKRYKMFLRRDVNPVFIPTSSDAIKELP